MLLIGGSAGALPMCGRVSLAPSAPQEKILVTMKRMVSEIVLNFTPDTGLEVELVSVECVNVPMDMTPCREGSVPELRGDGDYATGDDMQCLMSGENVRLYMLEDASSDNDTPVSAGVPGSGELPGHLAYVDLKGHVRNSAGLVSADVDYRLVSCDRIMANAGFQRHILFHQFQNRELSTVGYDVIEQISFNLLFLFS